MKLNEMGGTLRLVLIVAAALVVAYVAIKVLGFVMMVVTDLVLFLAVVAVIWLLVRFARSTLRRGHHPSRS